MTSPADEEDTASSSPRDVTGPRLGEFTLDAVLREGVRRIFREELAPLIRAEVSQTVRRHLDESRWADQQAVQSNPPSLLTVKETAAHCGVTEPTVREWIRTGLLPARRPGAGRVYRIRREDLDAFLLKRPQTRGEEAPDVDEQVERILHRVRGKARNKEG